MIAIVHWLKLIIIVGKLTLVVELQVLLSSCGPPLLEHPLQLSLAVELSRKAHKDSEYTAMITVMNWQVPKLTLMAKLW